MAVHMIICAIDYNQTPNPLTCSVDGRNMEQLAAACGVQDVTAMYDEQCQQGPVIEAIQTVASRCQSGDCFIFYYSGHGTSMEDESGDEADGQDEALCFVDSAGQVNYQSCMSDDVFAATICECMNPDVKVLILADCCHSGTIADFNSDIWAEREIEAVSITGCMDKQTSGDMGKGGIFTHSMLMAIDKLQQAGENDYDVKELYNATLAEDDEVFSSPQDITLSKSSPATYADFDWPLIPLREYDAPLNQAAGAVMGGGGKPPQGALSPESLADFIQGNPQMLQQLGVSPQMLQMLLGDGRLDVNALGMMSDPSEFLRRAKGGICGQCSIM